MFCLGNPSLPITPVTPEFPKTKENTPVAQRLPPHLRWKEKLSPKTQEDDVGQPEPSQTTSQANYAAGQASPPHDSTAERSRVKEQARLDIRTGVAKVKGSKEEEIALPKYEGSDIRNATLATAKDDKPFPCPFKDCPAGYPTKEKLLEHEQDCHEYCKKCKLWFENYYMLYLHKIEAPVHIICVICNVEFYTGTARDAHVRQVSLAPRTT